VVYRGIFQGIRTRLFSVSGGFAWWAVRTGAEMPGFSVSPGQRISRVNEGIPLEWRTGCEQANPDHSMETVISVLRRGERHGDEQRRWIGEPARGKSHPCRGHL